MDYYDAFKLARWLTGGDYYYGVWNKQRKLILANNQNRMDDWIFGIASLSSDFQIRLFQFLFSVL